MLQRETLASFRVFTLNLDPDEITKATGIIPVSFHRRGDHPRNNLKYAAYTHNLWALESDLSRAKDIEAHLDHLLSKVEGWKEYFSSLTEADLDFFVTVFNKNGIQLSPQILLRIAQMGVGLGVTIYPGQDEVIEI